MRYTIIRRGNAYELFENGKWRATELDLYRVYEQIIILEGIEVEVEL